MESLGCLQGCVEGIACAISKGTALRVQKRKLEAEVQQTEAELETERQKVEMLDKKAEDARLRAVDLEKKVEAAKEHHRAKHFPLKNLVQADSSISCFSCLTCLIPPAPTVTKEQMEDALKQVEQDLQASKAAFEKLRAQAMELEAKAQQEGVIAELAKQRTQESTCSEKEPQIIWKSQQQAEELQRQRSKSKEEEINLLEQTPPTSVPVPASFTPEPEIEPNTKSATEAEKRVVFPMTTGVDKIGSAEVPPAIEMPKSLPFSTGGLRQALRFKTPAEQREMKHNIEQLLEELECNKAEIECHKEMQEDAKVEVLNQEGTALALEVELRSYQREDKVGRAMLDNPESGQPGVFGSFRSFYSQKAPQEQQQLSNKLKGLLAELKQIETLAAAAHRSHKESYRKLSDLSSGSVSRNNSSFSLRPDAPSNPGSLAAPIGTGGSLRMPAAEKLMRNRRRSDSSNSQTPTNLSPRGASFAFGSASLPASMSIGKPMMR